MKKTDKQLQREVKEIRRFVDGDSIDVAMKPVLKTGKSIIHCNKGDQPHEWKFEKWQDWCCPVCGWFVGQSRISITIRENVIIAMSAGRNWIGVM